MYSKAQAQNSQEQLIQRYAPLVKRIAYHLLGRLPASVQVEDLMQAGMIGLLEAAKKYDAGKGASFETYAGIRIRGAMLDEVRKGDWAPRSVHRNTRMVTDAIRAIEARTGRDAKDHEVAAELQLSLEDYYGILSDTQGSRLYSFDDLLQDGEHGLPEDTSLSHNEPIHGLLDERFQAALADAIAKLPERERLVLALYTTRNSTSRRSARYWASANRGSASCTASAPRVCARAWPIGGRPEPASTAACNR